MSQRPADYRPPTRNYARPSATVETGQLKEKQRVKVPGFAKPGKAFCLQPLHLPDRRGADRSPGTAGRGPSSQQTTLGLLKGRIVEPVKVGPHIAQTEDTQLEILGQL